MQYPSPTKFYRGHPLKPDDYEPPKHPVIRAVPTMHRYNDLPGMRITMLNHQDSYGPRGRVLPLTDPRRFTTLTILLSEYETLPTCSWVLRDGRVTALQILDDPLDVD